MPRKSSFHAPLLAGDTPTQTVGCRHTNPEICAKNELTKVCAFVRGDNLCMAPPASWPKQFRRLQVLSGDGEAP